MTDSTLWLLPAELRVRIYRQVFGHSPWLSLHIYNNVFDALSDAQALSTAAPGSVASLMSSSRVIHAEAVRELLDLSDVQITVSGLPEDARGMKTLGSIGDVTFWKSLLRIKLDVAMHWDGKLGFSAMVLLERTRKVVEALQGGRHLSEIHIRLLWPDSTPVPGCLQNVTEILGELRLHSPEDGRRAIVSVTIAGDMEDQEKATAEDRLRDRILPASLM